MLSSEIRSRFLKFFEQRGHKIIESDLLVPRNDDTLLFTGAGMNQFKEQFMGKNITSPRAVSCQKCLRTGDIENVGRTPRHHTFFEMLGNFSFGDYFKKEAISLAWEFMTEAVGIAEDKLWVSVYEKDDESYAIWRDMTGVPEARIVRLGAKDNFWPSDAPTKGPNGPCGPCSEIFYDKGPSIGCGEKDCSPACDCGRFVEIWNLVFTEFERKEDGSMKPLPNRNIDTGMGLERIAAVLQGADTNFGTDLFVPIVERTAELIKGEKGRTPGESDLFLISDHVRAITFAIGDGVSPSNEGRGYVIRKLIRRAFLKSGQRVPFLYRLVNEVTFQMKAAYPLTHEKTEHISAIVKEEEARFSNTLDTAMPILEEIAASAKHELEGGKIFKLVDTYGLPFDVIREVAAKRGLELDTDGFREKMRERKEQSRKSSDISGDYIFKPDMFGKAPKPGFSDDMPLEADIEYIVKDGAGSADINKGEQAEIIISPQSSLFYCESGGQCGDTGSITGAGGRLRILNTLETDGRKVFLVKAEEGVLRKGDRIKLTLDTERKKKIARNHTATHLLQAALRQVLGEEVRQSGSSVDEEKLRFDFTHLQKVTDREKIRIEKKVNGWINEASSVSKAEKPIEEAKKEGALSFFGEKYGETVRVVSIPGRSKELCGGTHVKNTSEIGFFAIMSESSVASGIRRIEAATGEEAGRWLRGRISRAVEELKEGAEDPEKYIDKDIFSEAISIIEGKRAIDAAVLYDYEERLAPAFENASRKLRKEAKKRMKALQKESFEKVLGKLDEKLSEGTSGFVGAIFENTGMKTLRRAAKHVERTLDKGIAVLAGRDNGKAYLVCVRTGDVDEGPGADEIIKEAAAEIKGKGGGKAEFAQAGGNDPDGLERALEAARKIVTGKNS